MGDRILIDAQGHPWVVTGRWCRVCRMPLHRLTAPNEDAHPLCREEVARRDESR
ncbi:hypothetical protein [Kytococcus sedentarius]|uniref:hypothetical protein n=1 Tax=Kytococcus sedentarius TaxID=1276 RepID=UPI00384FBF5D